MADISKIKTPDGTIYNIKDDNAATKLDIATTSATLSDSHFSSIILRKSGGVKFLSIGSVNSNTAMDTTNNYVQYFTLPEEYRPIGTVVTHFQSYANGAINSWMIRIATNGTVSLLNRDGVEHPGFSNTFTFI